MKNVLLDMYIDGSCAVAAAKKVAPLIASKKTANNITKWNQVQEVLSTGQSTPNNPEVAAPPKAATPEKKTTPVPAALPEEVEFEFSDVVKIACLLCARQFKTLDQLKKHNKESDLHKVFFLILMRSSYTHTPMLKMETAKL
jgi:RNA-binding protein 5/10